MVSERIWLMLPDMLVMKYFHLWMFYFKYRHCARSQACILIYYTWLCFGTRFLSICLLLTLLCILHMFKEGHLQSWKKFKMYERRILLGVKCPQSSVEDILQNPNNISFDLIFSLKSSFCASLLPSNKDFNPSFLNIHLKIN